MGFARKHAGDLRDEARQLEALGFSTLAKDRLRESELYDRVADEVEGSEDGGQPQG